MCSQNNGLDASSLDVSSPESLFYSLYPSVTCSLSKDMEILLEYCKANGKDYIIHGVENCHAYQQVQQNNLQKGKRE